MKMTNLVGMSHNSRRPRETMRCRLLQSYLNARSAQVVTAGSGGLGESERAGRVCAASAGAAARSWREEEKGAEWRCRHLSRADTSSLGHTVPLLTYHGLTTSARTLK